MNKSKLLFTHPEYTERKTEWELFYASYKGSKALLDIGALPQHERESTENYKRRLNKAYGFSYSTSIIDLLNFYLFKNPTPFFLDMLAKDPCWTAFVKDCDLYKTEFDEYLMEKQRDSSIYGFVGILVDKPEESFETKEGEITANVYPYLSSYTPLNILDWKEERDKYSRPYLSYLKLKDNDGSFRLWWVDKWEVWILDDNDEAVLKHSNVNRLNEIPFVWLINTKSDKPYSGVSDIKDISYIDISIMNNLSQGEEIIEYAAFPMMRKPKKEIGDTGDDAGVTAILEFDPDNPESKADWLEAQCKEPIDAILLWIGKKVDEIYRVANTGGISATEKDSGVKSGVALRTEFELLNSKLVKRGINVSSAKYNIIRLWTMWQNTPEIIENITYEKVLSYDVEKLSTDLENALVAKTLITGSSKFQNLLQKSLVRLILPALSDIEFNEIDKELDTFKFDNILSEGL